MTMHDEGYCPGGCGRPTDDAEERMCEECAANGRSVRGIYVPLPCTENQLDRYNLWQARQWLEGRIDSHCEVGTRGVTVFADFPKPKHPSAQEAA